MTKVEELTGRVIANVMDGIRLDENDPIALPVATQQVNALISAVDADAFARGKAEGVVEYLVKKLMKTIEEGNVKMENSLMAVRKCFDKLETNHD